MFITTCRAIPPLTLRFFSQVEQKDHRLFLSSFTTDTRYLTMIYNLDLSESILPSRFDRMGEIPVENGLHTKQLYPTRIGRTT